MGHSTSPAPRKRFSLRAGIGSWREELRGIDWPAVHSLMLREASIAARSRAWTRLLAWFGGGSAALALLPILYRVSRGRWQEPSGETWLRWWAVLVAAALLLVVSGWVRRRMLRELRGGAVDEILLTGSGPADILIGKALSTAALALLLAVSALPGCLIITAVGGESVSTAIRLVLSLALVGSLGLCFGLETAFRQGQSLTWNLVYWLFNLPFVLGGILSGFCGLAGLARELARRYNPVSMLLAAAGDHPERWTGSAAVLSLVLLCLTAVNLRLLRREWSAGIGPAREKGRRNSWLWIGADARGREAGSLCFDERPVLRLEEALGHRIHLGPAMWLVLGSLGMMVVLGASLSGFAAAGLRVTGAMLLGLGTAAAAHSGCAAAAQAREAGRWADLALLPYSNACLLREKLGPAAASIRWYALSAAVLALLAVPVSGAADTLEWGLWLATGAVVLPLSGCVLGALFGVLTPSPGEAHWRTGCLFVGLPFLFLTAGIAGIRAGFAEAICPLYPAFATALLGSVSLSAWAGLLMYAAAGALCWSQLSVRLREWTVGSP